MLRKISFFALLWLGVSCLPAQINADKVINAGPILGYAEMREAVVWIQAKMPGNMYLVFSHNGVRDTSNVVLVKKDKAFTAKLLATNLEAGTTYEYTIYFNDQPLKFSYPLRFTTQTDWAYKSDPPAFTMAAGSCAYINEPRSDRPGKPYGGDYHIYENILKQKPDAMLWLGDNVYLRPSDYTSRSGYLTRYTHDRALDQLQALYASCNHFAIWDDHDFGANDAPGSIIHRETALEVFELFWPNPPLGFRGNKGAVTAFQYNGIDFFLLDNRYYRTQHTEKGTNQILGEAQIEWLIEQLKFSKSPYKIVAVGGQVLNTAQVYETHAVYAEERDYLLRRISEENISGVVFLTGDRHHSEVSVLQLPSGKNVYDFTISPLTSGPNTNVNETNENRIPGSLIQQRNYALLSFSGTFRARKLTVTYYSSNNKVLYTFEVDAQK
ncbi:MAG: alkaline phosphatase family protein [Cryomorphaceae bacterium]|nr:alkaline phosphatase family protein [Cryomorphaceae bacterium]